MIELLAGGCRWLAILALLGLPGLGLWGLLAQRFAQRRLAICLCTLGLAALLGLLAAQAALATGHGPDLLSPRAWWRFLTHTQAGLLLGLRQLALLIALLALLLLGKPRHATLAGGLLASGGLCCLALGGHAAAGGNVLWAVVETLHLACASLWFGGLLALRCDLPVDDPGSRTALLAVLTRFSRLALPLMGGVALTGLLLANALLAPRYAALLATPWGAWLLLKLALLVGVLGLAARVRFGALPRLRAAMTEAGFVALVQDVKREFLLALLLLGAAAALGMSIPGVHALIPHWPWPFRWSLDSTWPEPGTPRQLGAGAVLMLLGMVALWQGRAAGHRSGTPMPSDAIGAIGDTHSMWDTHLSDRSTASIGDTHRSGPNGSMGSGSIRDTHASAMPPAQLANESVPSAFQSGTPTQTGERSARHLLLGALALGGGGLFVLYTLAVPASSDTYLQSGVPFDALSIAKGRAHFAEHCTGCHGLQGKGDGPLAGTLPKRPVDLLTEPHTARHTAGDFFNWLGHGIPQTGMPAFATILDEDARWDVVNFLHALNRGFDARILRPASVPFKPVARLAAPAFSYRRADGQHGSLRALRERAAVLLVLYRLPASASRLQALAQVDWQGLDTVVLAVAQDGQHAALPFDVVDDAGDIAATYQLFRRSFGNPDLFGAGTAPAHMELLIDRFGYLRARWLPEEEAAGWSDLEVLKAEIAKLASEPSLLPAPDEHVH